MKTFCCLLTTIALSGCVTQSLRHQTSSQIATTMDMRYDEVVQNLALIYANPEALPAYTSVYIGSCDVGDTMQATSGTTWMRSQPAGAGKGPFVTLFNKQTLDLPVTRSVKDNWVLDPTVLPEKLSAMKCACRWVLFGRESIGPEGIYLGRYTPPPPHAIPTEEDRRPQCYFDVMDQLDSIDANYSCWLHLSDCLQRPRCARYWASCHGKCVWVEPEGMEALSQFTLIIQKIARADYPSSLQPLVQTRTIKLTNVPLQSVPPNNCSTTVTLNYWVDQWGTPTLGSGKPALPIKSRVDNIGVNADVKSALSANTKSP